MQTQTNYQLQSNQNNTTVIEVKKQFLGCVSIREYIFQRVLKQKQNLLIQFDGNECFYPNDKLLELSKRLTRKEFTSKFSDKKYFLVDLPFSINKTTNKIDNQFSLFA